MNYLKNNLKVIVAFILGLILAGGIVYAAVTSADEVSYSTSKNGEVQTVEDALNDLYNNSNQDRIVLWANSLLWGTGSYNFVNLNTGNKQLTKINDNYFEINNSGQIVVKRDAKVKIINFVNPTNGLKYDSKIKTEVNNNIVIEVNGGKQQASYASNESNNIELNKDDVISLYQQGGESNPSAYSWLIYLSI